MADLDAIRFNPSKLWTTKKHKRALINSSKETLEEVLKIVQGFFAKHLKHAQHQFQRECILELTFNSKDMFGSSACADAIMNNSIEYFRFVAELLGPKALVGTSQIGLSIFEHALRRGDLELIKYIYQNYPGEIRPIFRVDTIFEVFSKGLVDVAQFLWENFSSTLISWFQMKYLPNVSTAAYIFRDTRVFQRFTPFLVSVVEERPDFLKLLSLTQRRRLKLLLLDREKAMIDTFIEDAPGLSNLVARIIFEETEKKLRSSHISFRLMLRYLDLD